MSEEKKSEDPRVHVHQEWRKKKKILLDLAVHPDKVSEEEKKILRKVFG